MKLKHFITLTFIIASFTLSAIATNEAFTITYDSSESYSMNTWPPQSVTEERQFKQESHTHFNKRKVDRIIQAFLLYCVIGYLYFSRRHIFFTGLDYSSRTSASILGILMSPFWPILLIQDGMNWFKISRKPDPIKESEPGA